MKLGFNKKDLEREIERFQILTFDIDKSYGGVNLDEISVLELKNYISNNFKSIKPDTLRDYFLTAPTSKLICEMYSRFPKVFNGEKKELIENYVSPKFEFPKYVQIK